MKAKLIIESQSSKLNSSLFAKRTAKRDTTLNVVRIAKAVPHPVLCQPYSL